MNRREFIKSIPTVPMKAARPLFLNPRGIGIDRRSGLAEPMRGRVPHNASYNPAGPVGALAYWTADAIKNRYLKNPGPLVPA
jgi:hypothetical protein